MKTFNYKYQNLLALENFIEHNNIRDSKSMLIQVFTSLLNKIEIEKVLLNLSELFPKATIIGCTTDGEILEDKVLINSTIISFTIFEATEIESYIVSYNLTKSFEAGEEIAKKLVSENSKVLLLFSDGLNTNGENLLNGIRNIDKDIIVSGGLAGDYGKFQSTFVFLNKEIREKSTVAIVLNSQILKVHTEYNFNWHPVGKAMKITKSIDNRVFTIDNIDAVDIYKKYLGKDISKELPKMGIEFPLIIQKNGINIARAVLIKHDDKSLTFAGNLEVGTVVRLGVGTSELIKEDTLKSLEFFDNKAIESIFIYSCMARRRFLGESINSEISATASIASSSGFFTYGEYFTDYNNCELMNETMTMLALSENNNSIVKYHYNYQNLNDENSTKILALSNLINKISDELNELNQNLELKVKRRSNEILKQYYKDQLTNLPNRLKLIDEIKNKQNSNVVLINIDHFSKINSFYGSRAGDFVIQKVGRLLKKVSFELNFKVYKLQADEFIILFDSEIKFDKYYQKKIANILLSFMKNQEIIYKKSKIDISFTLAIASGQDDVLLKVDMARKFAKNSKSDYEIYNDSLKTQMKYAENIIWSKKISDAIKNDRIQPFFQPIISSNGNKKVSKYEALIRLIDEDDTVITPYHFMQISKTTKQYNKLTRIMLEKSFKIFKGTDDIFSINISMEDVTDIPTREFIYKMVKENIGCAKRLILEIVESEAIEDIDILSKFILYVKQYGVKIAIDDFGTGYSNFEYLTKLEPDFIKIDGSLIRNIDNDKKSLIIVETIIDFAKKVNSKTIAEFVHSKEIFNMVQNLGIDYLQGYYIGEPNIRATPPHIKQTISLEDDS